MLGLALFAVDRRIQGGVVIHLELAVDLEPRIAAGGLFEEAVKASREILPLFEEARKARSATLNVCPFDILALGLQSHVVNLQAEDGEPIDH